MVHINIISESQITIPDHRPVRTYILRLKEVDSNLSPFKKKKIDEQLVHRNKHERSVTAIVKQQTIA